MFSSLIVASQRTRNLSFGLLLLAVTAQTNGLAISYCSPDLTAGSFQAVYSTWQSNGACQTTCQGSYAYAVLKGQNCWCSDYAPADQVSTYDCSTTCAGFPTEWCGNDAKGYYGYYQLDGTAPKGTSGASGSSSASSGSSVSNLPSRHGYSVSSYPTPSGDSSALTVIASVQTSIGTSMSTVRQSSTASSSLSTITRGVATPTEIYTSITTVTGQVRTVVITPTPSSDSTLGSGTTINSSGGGGGVGTGTVVGIVLGVALGLGLLIGLGVWFWLRRKHQRRMEAASLDDSSAHGNTSIPSRQVSQMSSAGLLGKAPRIQTLGLGPSHNPRSAETLSSNVDRRSLGTDQRLNPYAIYAHEESRHSNVSLQDNQDYSRQLRVANPDP